MTTLAELTLQARQWRLRQNLSRVPSAVSAGDRRLIWEYPAYAERPYSGSFGTAIAKFNRYGFRDQDRETTAKPVGKFRVAFVGDSVTEGLGVAVEYTFVRLFEDLMCATRSSNDVEALNFGVGGYQTVQIAALLDKVLPFQPDMVVYVMCPNDFDFIDASGGLVAYHSPPAILLPRWIQARTVALGYPRTHSGYYAAHFNARHDEVFAAIEEMKTRVHKIGAKFTVAILPHFWDAPIGDEYPFPEHQKILQYLNDSGIPHIDLLAGMKNSGVTNLSAVALDGWHPDSKGHRIIAEILADEL